ncbi:MAG: hypothetical protein V1895_03985 [Parcubacteria group bacterium]
MPILLFLIALLAAPFAWAQAGEPIVPVIRDTYIFNSNEDEQHIIVAAVLKRLDPRLLYQFNFDTNQDGIEDRVIQVTLQEQGSKLQATVTGPSIPERTGEIVQPVKAQSMRGPVSTDASPNILSERGKSLRAFVGRRDDPTGGELYNAKNVDLIAIDLATAEVLAEFKPELNFWVTTYQPEEQN